MRILLVGNYSLDKQTSMLRYVEMLCEQMRLRGHEVEVIRPQPVMGDWVTQPMLRKWLGYIDKFMFFPAKLRRNVRDFDIVHVCDHSNSMYLAHTGNRPVSITCHDLLAIESARGKYPQQKVSLSGKILQLWILRHLIAAKNVVCVSSNTAVELSGLSNNPAQVVTIIPNAVNPSCFPATEEEILRVRERVGIARNEPYLLHVGAEAWYKNRLGSLRIFQRLLHNLQDKNNHALHLVIAGHPFTEEMNAFTAASLPAGTVIEVINPSDDDLWSLYSGAIALLFPSWKEGFGWPLIEAQRCGCPVIASNRQPMAEVAGSAALYIDPADETEAAELIAANLDRLTDLKEAGFRNAARFDASSIFPAYDDFFKKVVRENDAQN